MLQSVLIESGKGFHALKITSLKYQDTLNIIDLTELKINYISKMATRMC